MTAIPSSESAIPHRHKFSALPLPQKIRNAFIYLDDDYRLLIILNPKDQLGIADPPVRIQSNLFTRFLEFKALINFH